MNKANKNKPTNEDITYWKGYIQGYRHAIEDLKGWSITKPDPYIPTITYWKENWTGSGGPTTATIATDGNWSFDAVTKLTPEDVTRIFSYKGD